MSLLLSNTGSEVQSKRSEGVKNKHKSLITALIDVQRLFWPQLHFGFN